MTTQRILIHGTTAQRMATTPALGQIGSDDETGRVVLGDGSTPGGIEMARLDEIGGGAAAEIGYNNAASGLDAVNVQAAVDEVVDLLDAKADDTDLAKRIRVDAVQTFTAAEKGQAISNLGGSALSGFRNKLINGDGMINQRALGQVGDDAYWCDRHYLLTQSLSIAPSVLTDVANGLPFMMRLTQNQVSAQRIGNAQIVEAPVSKRLRGKQVTLGGKLRCSASQPIRFAVLEWTGTADAVTSDVVANWTSGTFTAGNFFLASNLTVAAVGVITPAANTVTDWSIAANISGSCNNLIAIMWTEGTAAQNATLDMVWGLVVGDATAETWPYDARHIQQELDLCQRYYFATANGVYAARYSASDVVYGVKFAVRMRSVPSVAKAASLGAYASETVSVDSWSGYYTGTTTGLLITLAADAEL